MKQQTQYAIARQLAPLIGKEAFSVQSMINQVVNGKRPLPEAWEQHVFMITGCKDNDELRKMFPKIYFKSEKRYKPNDLINFEIELVVENSIGIANQEQLADILRALDRLSLYGINIEARIKPKSKE